VVRWGLIVAAAALACGPRRPTVGAVDEARALRAMVPGAHPTDGARGATVVAVVPDPTRAASYTALLGHLRAVGVALVDTGYRPGPDTTLLRMTRPQQDSLTSVRAIVEQWAGTRTGPPTRMGLFVAQARCDARSCTDVTFVVIPH
jgi:hypothetical protein